MIGNFLDMIPNWILIIMGVLIGLYYIQILAGLLTMSDHQEYPEIKVEELEKMVWYPFYLYYILIFTKKLR
jgi:hypothetical protein